MIEFTFFEILGSMFLTVLFIIIFLRSRDMVLKQLALFTASYFVFVFFSKSLFGQDFSSKTHVGNFGIELITINLLFFFFSFYFAANVGSRRVKATNLPIRKPGGRTTTINTLFLAIPILSFFAYYASNNGIRLTGAFLEYRGQRSTLTDYFFIYYVAILACYRNSRLVFFIGLTAITSHILSAERLRAFVYIIVILINYYQIDTRRHLASSILLCGFVLATTLGLLRTGSLIGNQDYNITHFGSVTVSSLYLLDFGSTITATQKLMFSIGTMAANLVPSSLIPEAYNIRLAILTFANIPGGGWLPIFFAVQSGLFGVIAAGFLVGKGYQRILVAAQRHSIWHPAYYAAVLVFVGTVPRWFMYTPYQILKMPLYAFILTAILIFVGRITSMHKVTNGT